jgi:soluble lytic murein transglycosylase-like protein
MTAALYSCLALAAFCTGMLVCRAQQTHTPISSPSHIRQPVNPNARENPPVQNPDAPLAFRPLRFAVENAPLSRDGRFPKLPGTTHLRPEEEAGFSVEGRPGTSPRLAKGRVLFRFLDGTAEIVPLGQSAAALAQVLPDPLQANYFVEARDFGRQTPVPALYGEEWDREGFPLRWRRTPETVAEGDILACTPDRSQDGLLRLLVRGFRPDGGTGGMAAARFYKNTVSHYAEKYNLSPAMVLAVMHTESHFNPLAVSRSKAVGLMQIVPDSAGYEAHRYLTGSPGTPGLDILMSPEKNISYGTAYMHLLGRRYFGGVHDSYSRQICVIAAYNGGPKAVLRLFDPEDDKSAVERINSLSPEQLYTHLTTRMPNSETRRYVELVLGRMHGYSAY